MAKKYRIKLTWEERQELKALVSKGRAAAPARLLGCSERIPRRRICPVGNGVQVAFLLASDHPLLRTYTNLR